ncbi:hypothetical protein, partial [Porphyromonas canoris]|uniref:hypothetical protein n=1 Tax=Porphyromonas canoris TaxID=36875 RepID=UPI00126A4C8F
MKKIKEKIARSSIGIFIRSGEKAIRIEEEKRKKKQTGKPIKTKERAMFLLRFMPLSFSSSGGYLLSHLH